MSASQITEYLDGTVILRSVNKNQILAGFGYDAGLDTLQLVDPKKYNLQYQSWIVQPSNAVNSLQHIGLSGNSPSGGNVYINFNNPSNGSRVILSYFKNDANIPASYLTYSGLLVNGSGYALDTDLVRYEKVIDLSNNNKSEKTPVQLWDATGSDAQKWYLRGGTNNLQLQPNGDSNWAVDLLHGNTPSNGLSTILWESDDDSSQHFDYVNNVFKYHQDNNYCLDVPNANYSNGQQLQSYKCNNNETQLFYQPSFPNPGPIYVGKHDISSWQINNSIVQLFDIIYPNLSQDTLQNYPFVIKCMNGGFLTASSSNSNIYSNGNDQTNPLNQWVFIPKNIFGAGWIQNKSTGNYMYCNDDGSTLILTTGNPNDFGFLFRIYTINDYVVIKPVKWPGKVIDYGNNPSWFYNYSKINKNQQYYIQYPYLNNIPFYQPFSITNRLTNKVWTVQDNSNIFQSTFISGNRNQLFFYTPENMLISLFDTSKAVDCGGNSVSSTALKLYDGSLTNQNQKFWFLQYGGLIKTSYNLVIDTPNGSINDEQLGLNYYNGTQAQNFISIINIIPPTNTLSKSAGYPFILANNGNTNTCLKATSGIDGSPLIIVPINKSSLDQWWVFQENGVIMNVKYGTCLDSGSTFYNALKTWSYVWKNSNQMWSYTDGTIVNKKVNKLIDYNGVVVKVYASNGTTAQKWTAIPVFSNDLTQINDTGINDITVVGDADYCPTSAGYKLINNNLNAGGKGSPVYFCTRSGNPYDSRGLVGLSFSQGSSNVTCSDPNATLIGYDINSGDGGNYMYACKILEDVTKLTNKRFIQNIQVGNSGQNIPGYTMINQNIKDTVSATPLYVYTNQATNADPTQFNNVLNTADFCKIGNNITNSINSKLQWCDPKFNYANNNYVALYTDPLDGYLLDPSIIKSNKYSTRELITNISANKTIINNDLDTIMQSYCASFKKPIKKYPFIGSVTGPFLGQPKLNITMTQTKNTMLISNKGGFIADSFGNQFIVNEDGHLYMKKIDNSILWTTNPLPSYATLPAKSYWSGLLYSPSTISNGLYTCEFQLDSNIVISSSGSVIWTSNTDGGNIDVIEIDTNITMKTHKAKVVPPLFQNTFIQPIITNPIFTDYTDYKVYKSTPIDDIKSSKLYLHTDGILYLIGDNNNILWCSSGVYGAVNGPFTLIMQANGNLVLYGNGAMPNTDQTSMVTSSGLPITSYSTVWQSNTFCSPTTTIYMEIPFVVNAQGYIIDGNYIALYEQDVLCTCINTPNITIGGQVTPGYCFGDCKASTVAYKTSAMKNDTCTMNIQDCAVNMSQLTGKGTNSIDHNNISINCTQNVSATGSNSSNSNINNNISTDISSKTTFINKPESDNIIFILLFIFILGLVIKFISTYNSQQYQNTTSNDSFDSFDAF